MVAIIVLLLLAGALFFFKFLMSFTIKNQIRYPPTQNCTDIGAMFNDNITVGSDYYEYAKRDSKFAEAGQGTGIY